MTGNKVGVVHMQRFASFTRSIALAALGFLLVASVAEAQRGPYERGQSRDIAGRFDYYSLVLSWSPTYCAGEAKSGDPQCRRQGRPYAFVLHGLWPQYERGYPERCQTRERPFVPNHIIDSMLDIMPSRKLVIHEYRKHGTCSGLTPKQYYDLSRRLYQKITIPKQFANPQQPMQVSPGEVVGAFLTANPNLRPDMLAISCRGSGNRMREVRICFSRQGEFRRCGSNENQRRLCTAPRMYVPPVRSAGGIPETRL
ncbi:MAG: hypothetical protein RLZ98_2664 [Pseudomonadota bacterium]|jgi:ribonuclease T2